MSNIINKTKEGYTHYNKYNNDYFFGKPTKIHKALPPGIYTAHVDRTGEPFVCPMSAMTDTLIRLPNFTSEKVIKEVEKFWSQETKDKFIKRKLVYKRGILLHGAPGCGKTACVAQVMEAEVNAGGIVFFGPTPSVLQTVVEAIREVQGDVRCLVVWEEFDQDLEGDEAGYLSLLDGEKQIDNVVYLATTNYLDRIPPRFQNRPSRFASKIEVGLPDIETRRTYIESKLLPGETIDMDKWLAGTEEFTIDHIKDLIISVFCLDLDFDEAVDRLKELSYDQDKAEELAKDQRKKKINKFRNSLEMLREDRDSDY